MLRVRCLNSLLPDHLQIQFVYREWVGRHHIFVSREEIQKAVAIEL